MAIINNANGRIFYGLVQNDINMSVRIMVEENSGITMKLSFLIRSLSLISTLMAIAVVSSSDLIVVRY